MQDSWAQLLRDRADSLLLLVMLLCWQMFVLHIMHHVADASAVAWAREQTSGVEGALLAMLTGAARSKASQ